MQFLHSWHFDSNLENFVCVLESDSCAVDAWSEALTVVDVDKFYLNIECFFELKFRDAYRLCPSFIEKRSEVEAMFVEELNKVAISEMVIQFCV